MNPTATNHKLSWFRQFHSAGALDLSPRFQRKPVWSDAQAAFLIDSILNDLPIPEVFLRTSTSAAGDTRIEVVDGQQRLRSIIRFFSNDLELLGDDVSEEWYGTTWEQLSDEDREKFWSYQVVVRELENASDSEVRDMFHRLNANQLSLNDQELRHSQYTGEFISLTEELAEDAWWLLNRLVTPNQVRRMLDVEYIAELLVGLISGPLDKKSGLEDYFIEYDEELPDRDSWVRTFGRTRALTERVLDGEFKGWRSKTEYYSLFLACGRLISDRQVPKGAALQGGIERLRKFRDRVDRAKRKDTRDSFPQYIRDYADAVTRASTDLGRRLYRIDVIEALLLGRTPTAA